MHRTIFTTPGVSSIFRALSIGFLRVRGWRVQGALPPEAHRSVLIAAPHTSNWDLPYTLMVAFALRLNVYWMGKNAIFQFPFRGLMMWLGGVPVNREQSTNMVAASAKALSEVGDGAPIQLIVPPEGTRSKTRYWKTGFYYIAQTAQVPIILAYLDYQRKEGGLGPVFQPTGDIETDMNTIKAFYANVRGKNADQFEAN